MSIICLSGQCVVGWTNWTGVRSLALRRRSASSALSASGCPSAAAPDSLDASLENALRNIADADVLRVARSGRLRSPVCTAGPAAPAPLAWRQSHTAAATFGDTHCAMRQSSPTAATATATATVPHSLTHVQLSIGWAPRRGYRSLCPAVLATPLSPPPIGCSAGRWAEPGARHGARPAQSVLGWLPRRTFKTHRSVVREMQRCPSLAERLRSFSWLQLAKPPAHLSAASTPSVDNQLDDLLEKSSSEQERSRLKVAFAEGYAASRGRSAAAGAAGGDAYTRFSTLVSRSLIRLVVAAVVLSLLVTTLGPMGRNMMLGKIDLEDVVPEIVNVSFGDVKGIDEVKQELQDIVAFLRDPDRFSSLGGKLPKGVLLTGPPGTGKTLLARAVAGEAGVPFFHAAGSEFDEVLVGQGARRVRELFRVAKQRAPCVVFIDEIDSVGGKRSASRLHPFANQTINQLLSEMDGFHSNDGVIVMGATNRRDHLDIALLRPGRFDVEVLVNPPDLQGRREIFELYLSRIKVQSNVDVDSLARGTIGLTGADIENMVNQAALRAAILSSRAVTMEHLDWARDKVLLGVERKCRIPDEETNLVTAYHESGHTLVALFTKCADPVHKVTIMPRSRSLGHTSQMPAKEQFQLTKAQLTARLDVMMGGRAAEEIIFGSDHVTSGASDDLKKATSLASAMVRELGMSEALGVRVVADQVIDDLPSRSVSDTTMHVLDTEIKRLLQESYDRAKQLLQSHAAELKLLAEALMKHETLTADDLQQLLKTGSVTQLDSGTGANPLATLK